MRKKCRFAGLFLAGFSVFALAGCGNSNNGFTVTFNSNGGSSVEPFISYDGKVMDQLNLQKMVLLLLDGLKMKL